MTPAAATDPGAADDLADAAALVGEKPVEKPPMKKPKLSAANRDVNERRQKLGVGGGEGELSMSEIRARNQEEDRLKREEEKRKKRKEVRSDDKERSDDNEQRFALSRSLCFTLANMQITKQEVAKLDIENLFKETINWDKIKNNETFLEGTLKTEVTRLVIEYLGEEEESLNILVKEMLEKEAGPQDLVGELEPLLDEEAEAFVAELWRFYAVVE